MSRYLTVATLIEHLNTLLADGQVSEDTIVSLQGCDCDGLAKNLEVTTTDGIDNVAFALETHGQDQLCVRIKRWH